MKKPEPKVTKKSLKEKLKNSDRTISFRGYSSISAECLFSRRQVAPFAK